MPLERRPGIISLLAGKPNASTFPITSLQFTARSPDDPTKEQTFVIEGEEIDIALQYNMTAGIPELLKWVWGLQEFSHGRKKGEGWRSSIGSGSQDVICKVRRHSFYFWRRDIHACL
jgi:tryptophan aminotransferase